MDSDRCLYGLIREIFRYTFIQNVIMSHSDRKRLKRTEWLCRFCGKSFKSGESRRRHEKVVRDGYESAPMHMYKYMVQMAVSSTDVNAAALFAKEHNLF
jgi:hypothetical protein